jgi:hypothetical protein
LAFIRAVKNPDAGRHELGEELAELAEFEKAGVRIVREIPLRKHPEPQKLLIMRLQMGEVAAQEWARLHEVRCFGGWGKWVNIPGFPGGLLALGLEGRLA